ncbi:hypothetical protein LSPCS325_18700 [Lysinibacillus sp. CTST325]
MKKVGYLIPVSVDAMTHCLSGAMNETAISIAENTLEEASETITNLLEELKNKQKRINLVLFCLL